MGAGQKAVARQGGEAPPRPPQRQGRIHHGQARPDQKHVARRLGRGRIQPPGVLDIGGRGAHGRVHARRRGRLQIAQRQHHLVHDDLAVRGSDAPAVVPAIQRAGLGADQGQALGRVLQRRVQQGLQIVAIDAAGDEAVLGAPRRLFRQPVGQMPRPVGKGAHIVQAHVQQMLGVAGVIGRAGPEHAAPLDQRHPHGGRSLKQVHGRQQAAEPRAHNGDLRPVSLCPVSL